MPLNARVEASTATTPFILKVVIAVLLLVKSWLVINLVAVDAEQACRSGVSPAAHAAI